MLIATSIEIYFPVLEKKQRELAKVQLIESIVLKNKKRDVNIWNVFSSLFSTKSLLVSLSLVYEATLLYPTAVQLAAHGQV